jgi:hypothetical protein
VDRNVFTEMSEEREIRKKPERLDGPISDLRGLEVGTAGEGFGQKFYRIAKDQRILLRNRQNKIALVLQVSSPLKSTFIHLL